jgi:hypothetical protein
LVARLLDMCEDWCKEPGSHHSASNPTDGLEASVESLVSQILAAGVTPPPLSPVHRPVAVRAYRETLRRLKETALEAVRSWDTLSADDKTRLDNPIAFLASVARQLTAAQDKTNRRSQLATKVDRTTAAAGNSPATRPTRGRN